MRIENREWKSDSKYEEGMKKKAYYVYYTQSNIKRL